MGYDKTDELCINTIRLLAVRQSLSDPSMLHHRTAIWRSNG